MGNMYVVMSKLKDRISTDNKHMIPQFGIK